MTDPFAPSLPPSLPPSLLGQPVLGIKGLHAQRGDFFDLPFFHHPGAEPIGGH